MPWPRDTECAIRNPSWRGQLIVCHSDNMAVVSQVNRLHAHDPRATHMLCCLAFFQALFDCRLHAVHIPGVQNIGADDLSRDRAAAFCHRFTHASPHPTQVPQELVHFLCHCHSDWTPLHLRELFSSFWKQALRNPPGRSTRRDGTITLPLWGTPLT